MTLVCYNPIEDAIEEWHLQHGWWWCTYQVEEESDDTWIKIGDFAISESRKTPEDLGRIVLSEL